MKYLNFLLVLLGLGCMNVAQAGVFELAGSFDWNRSQYAQGSYTWTRSWAASFGYFITPDSEIQVSFSDTTNRSYEPGLQDISYEDRVYSLNLIYYLFSDTSIIRPYFRGGVAQLNRTEGGTVDGVAVPSELDQLSVIGGIGLKVKIVEKFSIKAEATSYLTGGAIGSWQDNLTANIGVAFYF